MRPLFTLETLAEYLSLSVSHVQQRIACRSDFPKPVRPGIGKKGKPQPRWFPDEVDEWLRKQVDAA